MEIEVKNIKDGKNGSRIYPRTHANGVFTNNGNTVQNELDNENSKIISLTNEVSKVKIADDIIKQAREYAKEANGYAKNIKDNLDNIIDSGNITQQIIAQVAKNATDISVLKEKIIVINENEYSKLEDDGLIETDKFYFIIDDE